MERGEGESHLSRQMSKIVGRRICDDRNNNRGPRWHGTPNTMFQVAEADLSKVTVIIKKKRSGS